MGPIKIASTHGDCKEEKLHSTAEDFFVKSVPGEFFVRDKNVIRPKKIKMVFISKNVQKSNLTRFQFSSRHSSLGLLREESTVNSFTNGIGLLAAAAAAAA